MSPTCSHSGGTGRPLLCNFRRGMGKRHCPGRGTVRTKAAFLPPEDCACAKDHASDDVNRSRRHFLKSTGVVGVAASVIAPGGADAQAGPAALGPGAVPVRLNVNGRQLDLMLEPRVTLLDALRMRADLTGNKRGCDRGACGACTMLVDGRPVYSCSTLAIAVQGKQIRNVNGLAQGETLHPVQQAFCDKDALMCGFCTPGFVMASVGLLEKHPNADAGADSQGPRRQHLPLRHVPAHLRGGLERGRRSRG